MNQDSNYYQKGNLKSDSVNLTERGQRVYHNHNLSHVSTIKKPDEILPQINSLDINSRENLIKMLQSIVTNHEQERTESFSFSTKQAYNNRNNIQERQNINGLINMVMKMANEVKDVKKIVVDINSSMKEKVNEIPNILYSKKMQNSNVDPYYQMYSPNIKSDRSEDYSMTQTMKQGDYPKIFSASKPTKDDLRQREILLNEIKTRDKENENLKVYLNELENKAENFEKSILDIKKEAQSLLSKQNEEINSIKNESLLKTKEIIELKNQVEELSKNQTSVKNNDYVESISKFESMNELYTKEKNELQNSIEILKNELQILKGKDSIQRKEINNLKSINENLQKENISLNSKVISNKEETLASSKTNTINQKEMTELKNQLNDQLQKINELSYENSQYQQIIKEKNEKIEELSLEIERLNKIESEYKILEERTEQYKQLGEKNRSEVCLTSL